MNRFTNSIAIILALMVLIPVASAAGYGTSSITTSSRFVDINPGSSGTMGYVVNLASGGTWGTNLVIANQAQLSSEGITITASNPSGDPPFSGNLSITVASSATPGSFFQVTLAATGDDPSVNETNFTVNIPQTGASTTATSGYNTTGYNSTGMNSTGYNMTGRNTTAATTSVYSYNSGGSSNGNSGMMTEFLAFSVIAILVAAFLMIKMTSMTTRLIILGVLLIAVGTAAWLYADFGGASLTYLWAGVAGIVIGTLIWIYADWKAGAFMMKK